MPVNRTAARLLELRQKLAALEKIKQDMDPASGITVWIKRGVDQPDEADQVVQLEVCTDMEELLDKLLDAARTSILLCVRFCHNELKELQEVLGVDNE